MKTPVHSFIRRSFCCVQAVAASCTIASAVSAQVVFSETFENGLGQWNVVYGKVVTDPLQTDKAMTFSKVNNSGDTYTKTSFPPGIYSLSLDYLGLPLRGSAKGDFGGFVSAAGRWMFGTYCPAAASCLLIDDGRWHHYTSRFRATSSFRLNLEDWDGVGHSARPPGVAGDVFFDNIVLTRDTVWGTIAYGDSSPGCTGALAIAVASTPSVGNQGFAVTCTNAPKNGSGILGMTLRELGSPIRFSGITVWVDPLPLAMFLGANSNATGLATVALPIPSNGTLKGFRFYQQFVWPGPANPSPCPPQGVSATQAIEIKIQ
jgi:hypothetical protein